MSLAPFKAFLLFFYLAIARPFWGTPNSQVGASPVITTDPLTLHLTSLTNTTNLISLQHSIPSESIEWINATYLESSPQQQENNNRLTRDTSNNLSPRYLDATQCSPARRRMTLRNELRAVLSLLHSAQANLTLTHPVWRTLLAAQFRDQPNALARMKNLFGILRNSVEDSSLTITLSCNTVTPQCLERRGVPPDGREQVPSGYFSLPDNAVNLCDGFFATPGIEQMRCVEGDADEGGMSLLVSWEVTLVLG